MPSQALGIMLYRLNSGLTLWAQRYASDWPTLAVPNHANFPICPHCQPVIHKAVLLLNDHLFSSQRLGMISPVLKHFAI